MTRQREILNAIRLLAKERIPEIRRNYIEQEEKNFLRPSLTIQPLVTDYRDSGPNLRFVTRHYLLIVRVALDEYGKEPVEEMLDLQEKVVSLFACGYLRVGDRALKAKVSSGGTERQEAYVDLTLSYLDDRGLEEEPLPLMEELIMNWEKGD